MADVKIVIDTTDVKKANAETKELKRTYTALDKAMKPLIAKEKAFAQTVRAINDAMRLGLKTNKEAIADIQKLGKAYGYTEAQIDRVTASMTGVRKNTNRMNATIQNAGYQFGDFFVQVQSGQNILVAFSQQGAQLAGLLPGLAGAVTGVGLVVGSMLARALMEGTDLFKSFASASEEAKNAIDDLVTSTSTFSKALEGDLGQGAKKFAEVILQQKLKAAARETKEELEELRKSLQILSTDRSGFQIADPTGISSLLETNRALRIVLNGNFEASKQVVALIDEINQPLDLTSFEQLNKRLEDIVTLTENYGELLSTTQLDALQASHEAILSRIQQIVSEQEASNDEADKMTEELERQKAILQSINSLERQRLSIGEGLDKAFTRSTLVLKGMEEGLSKGIASQIASVQMQIDAERQSLQDLAKAEQQAAEAGVEGFLRSVQPGDVEAQYQKRIEQLKALKEELLVQEAMSRSSFGGSGGGSQMDAHLRERERFLKNIDDTLASYQKQISFETSLIGLSKEEAELTKFIYDLENKLGATRSQLNEEQQAQYDYILAAKEKEIELTKQQQIEEEKLAKAKEKVEAVASTLASETVGALKSIVNGTKTAAEAFRDMALNIIQQIMDILIWQPLIESLTNSISGAISGSATGGGTMGGIIGSIFGFQKGGAFSAGNVVPFAYGGVVNSPTMFGMSGGRTGLMGEAGPEAIMPLKRGSDGKLGVEGGGNVTVHQTFNFAANGDESVKKIIAEAAPKIAKMTEAQIINSRQRGGQMRRAFS